MKINLSAIFLLPALFLAGPAPLPAQMAIETADYFTPRAYPADSSVFYYNDVGMHTGNNAILMAASARDGGTIYRTLDTTVYVVGYGDHIYIAMSIEALRSDGMVPAKVELNTSLSNTIVVQGRQADATNLLAMYFAQLQSDQDGDRIIYLEGIGTSVIEDIDPSLRRSVEIPNNTVFSITTTTADCSGSSDFHQLIIRY